MRYQEIIDTIYEELSGINAREHVMQLTHYDRIQASPGFREAAEYVCRCLNEWGFESANILEFPADGKINQWDWESPIAWRAEEGLLWLVEPYNELLCDFKQVPVCLIAHSQSTMTVTHVIDVGTGLNESDYQREGIKDSIIMATGAARDIYPHMYKYGVQGLIRYPTTVRAFKNPDMIIHDGFWPVDEDRDKIPFGFSISRQQAERLKSLIAEGKKLKVKAKVIADLGDGHLDVVEAHIPTDFEDEEEILIISHLCHPKPSANHNASGCGLSLEVARTLRRLFLEGKLPPNRKIIRFLWLPEYSGAIAWLHWNYHKIGKIHSCINLDCVGESPERVGTPLRVSTPPNSSENFLEDLFEAIADLVARNTKYSVLGDSRKRLKYDMEIFSGISDHTIFLDSYFNIPTVMLGHEDPFSDTNLDTIENVDATELLRVGLIAASAAYILSAPSMPLARQLLLFQKAGALNRVNLSVKKALESIYNSLGPHLDVRFFNEVGKVSSLIKREEKNLMSLLRYCNNDEFREKLDEIVRFFKFFSLNELRSLEKALRERANELGSQISRLNTLPKEYRDAQLLIPERILNAPFKGVFKKVIFQRLHPGMKEWLRSNSLSRKNNVYGEIHNLINGTNSIFEIYITLDLEFGDIHLHDVKSYIVLMQKMKLVNIKFVMRDGKPGEDETRKPAEDDTRKAAEKVIILDEKDLWAEDEAEAASERAGEYGEPGPIPVARAGAIVAAGEEIGLDELLEEIDTVEETIESNEIVESQPVVSEMTIPDWDVKSVEKDLKQIVVKDTGEKDEETHEILIDDLEEINIDLNLDGLEERLMGIEKETEAYKAEEDLEANRISSEEEAMKSKSMSDGGEMMDFWFTDQ